MSIVRRPRRCVAHKGWSALALSLGLAACGGESESIAQDREQVASSSSAVPAAAATATQVAQPPNTEGRLLASNCFQCHGTLGLGGFDSIRGSEASEVLEFMTKTASRDIMAAHAQGYTPEQLQKIIAYLQQ